MLQEFIKAFSLIFIAEMGDKTQVLAMTCAAKYSPVQVMFGIFMGVWFNHGLAILIGTYISSMISMEVMQVVAGVMFIIFGFLAFREDDDESSTKTMPRFGPIFTVAGAFFIGELGDKTQLTAMTLSMEAEYPIIILLGTTAGMLVVGFIGIIIGTAVTRRVPTYVIKIMSGFVFIAFGLIKLLGTEDMVTSNTYIQAAISVGVVFISLFLSSKLLERA